MPRQPQHHERQRQPEPGDEGEAGKAGRQPQPVRAEARERTVGGKLIATPWEGRWSDYQRRDGMMVPMSGEVAWILPGGPKPYWRGRITALSYRFAD